ncbi:MAG: hypothetical protein BGO49_15480 [Planctomycetales bacterium 71-10]|nr:MAG: hypothetical protein BGO49_15480 [Planctomycetales bacterium 71-10]
MRGIQAARFVTVASLFIAPAGGLAAQEAATVEAAAKVVDLSTFPLMPGGVANGPRRLAGLNYAAPGDARGAFAFQKAALEEAGWSELPGGYQSDETCSGVFGKGGFKVSVATTPAGGKVDVSILNLGDVDPSKLPVPPDAKPLYAFPTAAAFLAQEAPAETVDALQALLTARGWEPYGEAGDVRFFKKNAVRLTARSTAAPAQGGATMIQLSSELMSADLPAPAKTLSTAYADATKALALDVDMTADDLAAFYRETLGKAGWKPTTEGPVKDGPRSFLIFRNDAKDLAYLEMRDVGDRLRATLTHRTAAEDAEIARRAEAAVSKRKADSKRQADMAAADRITFTVTVPEDARDVKYEAGGVEFKLPAGRGTAAAGSIRDELQEAGWKGDGAKPTPLGGAFVLTKKAGVVATIVYADAGFGDAAVAITAVGAEVERPAGPPPSGR